MQYLQKFKSSKLNLLGFNALCSKDPNLRVDFNEYCAKIEIWLIEIETWNLIYYLDKLINIINYVLVVEIFN